MKYKLCGQGLAAAANDPGQSLEPGSGSRPMGQIDWIFVLGIAMIALAGGVLFMLLTV
jgi:hypothetical protein